MARANGHSYSTVFNPEKVLLSQKNEYFWDVC